ncbi:nickel/cobalt transporter [Pseudogemmobacter blasticus]|uniref:Nickel/cobalt efflux system n=1 Tax=Fuscovulum blasticum DSM 2131 TaxID=1188250 RepID=A0A2T4JDS7_FUSBL|nr:hypothetical protein [Fuscovulum blasticum]PTE16046.1 hypothetical protein C5F44_03180 [Fuscovulum blasticum DSM 2131]
MRRTLTLAGLGLALVLAALWLSGAFDALSGWIGAAQRATQDRLAAAVRALRAGEPGAVAGLLVVCFGYGVLHATGPGHGKALIGGYGLARRVPLARLSVLALASSLAQAAVAVVLVYAAVAVLGLTRDAVTAAGGGWVTATGNLMVVGLGLWLVIRGLRGLGRLRSTAQAGSRDHDPHTHAHDHDHGPDCGCGHAHGPTLDQAAAVTSFRDAGLLIAGIALRPCSGALLLLVLTWQLGIGAAGIAGAFAMGLGVAVVTVAVAGVAVWAREGGLAVLPEGRLRWALPMVEVAAGLIIATAAIMLLLRQI